MTRSSRSRPACWSKAGPREDDLKAIDKEVRDIVADSADFAQADPEPDASELYTDISALRAIAGEGVKISCSDW